MIIICPEMTTERPIPQPDQNKDEEIDINHIAQHIEYQLLFKNNYPPLAGYLEHGLPKGYVSPFEIDLEEKDELGNNIKIKALEFKVPDVGPYDNPNYRNCLPYTITEIDIQELQDWLINYVPAHSRLQDYFHRTNKINSLPEPELITRNLSNLVGLFDQYFPPQD